MRCRLIVATAMLLVGGAGLAEAAPPTPYYLALGDSIALGVQPNPVTGVLGATNKGYANDLHALYRLRYPNLALKQLGCSGETTTTMLNGGKCDYYDLGTQLNDAVDFINSNRVVLITLSIGGDNVLRCFNLPLFAVDEPCVDEGLEAIGPELGQILEILRAAAGRRVPIVGMNYYDPFLAASTLGPVGIPLAVRSLEVTLDMNFRLRLVYSGFLVPVANVADAFRITDITMVPGYGLPRNVLLELAWTWVGAPPPVGPDIHPNAVGYAVIAAAFVRAIGSS
jgi:lysophospholipase L1-like esterase